jgi:hypothetical protein
MVELGVGGGVGGGGGGRLRFCFTNIKPDMPTAATTTTAAIA